MSGSAQTSELTEVMRKAYAVIPDAAGEILVVADEDGGPLLPGGECAEEEAEEAALERIVGAQCGIDIQVHELLLEDVVTVYLDSTFTSRREVWKNFFAAERVSGETTANAQWLRPRQAYIRLGADTHKAAVHRSVAGVDEAFVSKLPMWVGLGLAARCARLAVPEFESLCAAMPRGDRKRVLNAVKVAENFAKRGSGDGSVEAQAEADVAADAIGSFDRWNDAEGPAIWLDVFPAVAYAAGSAADVAEGRTWANRQQVGELAWRAVRAALICEPIAKEVATLVRSVAAKAAASSLDDRDPCPAAWLK